MNDGEGINWDDREKEIKDIPRNVAQIEIYFTNNDYCIQSLIFYG